MGAKRRGAAAAAAGPKRGKREARAELCAALRDAALRERAAAAWGRGEPLRHGTARHGTPPPPARCGGGHPPPLTSSLCLAEAAAVEPAPFRHGVIPGFLAGPAFAEALRDELLGLGFRRRSNDLLSLRQVGAGPGRAAPSRSPPP